MQYHDYTNIPQNVIVNRQAAKAKTGIWASTEALTLFVMQTWQLPLHESNRRGGDSVGAPGGECRHYALPSWLSLLFISNDGASRKLNFSIAGFPMGLGCGFGSWRASPMGSCCLTSPQEFCQWSKRAPSAYLALHIVLSLPSNDGWSSHASLAYRRNV